MQSRCDNITYAIDGHGPLCACVGVGNGGHHSAGATHSVVASGVGAQQPLVLQKGS